MIKAIYKITNNVNGKIYIGKSENLIRRWEVHLEDLFSNKHDNQYLQSDFNKFGYENFKFEIIKVFNPSTSNIELLQYESDCIIENNSLSPKFGYNITLPIKNDRNEQWKTSIKELNIFKKDETKINKILDNIIIDDIFIIQFLKNNFFKNINSKNAFTQNWFNDKENLKITKNALSNWNKNIRTNKIKNDLYWTTYCSLNRKIASEGLYKLYIDTWETPISKRNILAFVMNPNINSFKINTDNKILREYYDVFVLLDWIDRVSDIEKSIYALIFSPYLAEKLNKLKSDREIIKDILKEII